MAKDFVLQWQIIEEKMLFRHVTDILINVLFKKCCVKHSEIIRKSDINLHHCVEDTWLYRPVKLSDSTNFQNCSRSLNSHDWWFPKVLLCRRLEHLTPILFSLHSLAVHAACVFKVLPLSCGQAAYLVSHNTGVSAAARSRFCLHAILLSTLNFCLPIPGPMGAFYTEPLWDTRVIKGECT